MSALSGGLASLSFAKGIMARYERGDAESNPLSLVYLRGQAAESEGGSQIPFVRNQYFIRRMITHNHYLFYSTFFDISLFNILPDRHEKKTRLGTAGSIVPSYSVLTGENRNIVIENHKPADTFGGQRNAFLRSVFSNRETNLLKERVKPFAWMREDVFNSAGISRVFIPDLKNTSSFAALQYGVSYYNENILRMFYNAPRFIQSIATDKYRNNRVPVILTRRNIFISSNLNQMYKYIGEPRAEKFAENRLIFYYVPAFKSLPVLRNEHFLDWTQGTGRISLSGFLVKNRLLSTIKPYVKEDADKSYVLRQLVLHDAEPDKKKTAAMRRYIDFYSLTAGNNLVYNKNTRNLTVIQDYSYVLPVYNTGRYSKTVQTKLLAGISREVRAGVLLRADMDKELPVFPITSNNRKQTLLPVGQTALLAQASFNIFVNAVGSSVFLSKTFQKKIPPQFMTGKEPRACLKTPFQRLFGRFPALRYDAPSDSVLGSAVGEVRVADILNVDVNQLPSSVMFVSILRKRLIDKDKRKIVLFSKSRQTDLYIFESDAVRKTVYNSYPAIKSLNLALSLIKKPANIINIDIQNVKTDVYSAITKRMMRFAVTDHNQKDFIGKIGYNPRYMFSVLSPRFLALNENIRNAESSSSEINHLPLIIAVPDNSPRQRTAVFNKVGFNKMYNRFLIVGADETKTQGYIYNILNPRFENLLNKINNIINIADIPHKTSVFNTLAVKLRKNFMHKFISKSNGNTVLGQAEAFHTELVRNRYGLRRKGLINLFGNYIKARKYRDVSTRISGLIHNFRRGLIYKTVDTQGKNGIINTSDVNASNINISNANTGNAIPLFKSSLIDLSTKDLQPEKLTYMTFDTLGGKFAYHITDTRRKIFIAAPYCKDTQPKRFASKTLDTPIKRAFFAVARARQVALVRNLIDIRLNRLLSAALEQRYNRFFRNTPARIEPAKRFIVNILNRFKENHEAGWLDKLRAVFLKKILTHSPSDKWNAESRRSLSAVDIYAPSSHLYVNANAPLEMLMTQHRFNTEHLLHRLKTIFQWKTIEKVQANAFKTRYGSYPAGVRIFSQRVVSPVAILRGKKGEDLTIRSAAPDLISARESIHQGNTGKTQNNIFKTGHNNQPFVVRTSSRQAALFNVTGNRGMGENPNLQSAAAVPFNTDINTAVFKTAFRYLFRIGGRDSDISSAAYQTWPSKNMAGAGRAAPASAALSHGNLAFSLHDRTAALLISNTPQPGAISTVSAPVMYHKPPRNSSGTTDNTSAGLEFMDDIQFTKTNAKVLTESHAHNEVHSNTHTDFNSGAAPLSARAFDSSSASAYGMLSAPAVSAHISDEINRRVSVSLNNLADKLYSTLERRLRSERMRKGLL